MTLLPTENQGGATAGVVTKSYLVFNVTYRALNQGGETGNKPPQFIHSNCSLASNTHQQQERVEQPWEIDKNKGKRRRSLILIRG